MRPPWATSTRRLLLWFDTVLLGNRTIAQVWSYELVVEMRRNGLGICVAPALNAAPEAQALSGARLYSFDIPPQDIAAYVSVHYKRHEPHASFLKAWVKTAQAIPTPPLSPQPPFIAARLGA